MKCQIAVGVLVLLVCAAGCTGAPDTVRVGEEENGSTVTVAQGGQVTVSLPYDTVDRYQWRTDLSSGLVVTDEQTTPGTQEWTVEPLGPGTYTFRALWVKTWEPDSAAEKAFSVTIQVE